MTEPLDLDAIYAKIVSGYEQGGGLAEAIEDLSLLAAEVEWLRSDLRIARELIEVHVSAQGLVMHGPLLVTPEEKKLLEEGSR